MLLLVLLMLSQKLRYVNKETQKFTDRSGYGKAWREYWSAIHNGVPYYEAIENMRFNYGGIARKQAIPEINGIFNEKIEQMLSYIQVSIENEMGE